MMSSKTRLRFAPSPTGPLHIGGLRTALFNFLLAKKMNGSLVLRVEDTDLKRKVEGSQKFIEDSLSWAGIECDESPKNPGKYGPYNQSERKEIYSKYVGVLIEKGAAYYAFDTKEKLDFHRKNHEEKGKTFIYNAHNRLKLKNSLTLSKEETKELLNESEYVVRFKTPEEETITYTDAIRGDISVSTRDIDDKILFKSDGMPTYHLANVVDDHLMEISHVVRGEEWLPSLALHVLLYKAFEWKMPVFAHLPLILKPSGKGKLSKRDGAKFGFPVYPLNWEENGIIYKGFKEEGYLPEALNNYMVFLGWNNDEEDEIYSAGDLIEKFDLRGINKSGSKFNLDKLNWINSQHIQTKNNNELIGYVSNDFNVDDSLADKILSLIKPRLEKLSGLREVFLYLIENPSVDVSLIDKFSNETSIKLLEVATECIRKTSFNSSSEIKEFLFNEMKSRELKVGKVMPVLRAGLVGKLEGPDLFDLMIFLEKNVVLSRLEAFASQLTKP
jgi:glutamyl-tRNA synthetase